MKGRIVNATWIETDRKMLGLSRAGLADEIGITENAIYRIEKRLSKPSVPVLYKIADLFGKAELVRLLDPFMDAKPYPKAAPQDETLFDPELYKQIRDAR